MKMKTILVLVLLTASVSAIAQVDVNGYYRNDGTYVQPHHRTAPNNTISDNYSTRGNINPYTGQPGTVPNNGYDANAAMRQAEAQRQFQMMQAQQQMQLQQQQLQQQRLQQIQQQQQLQQMQSRPATKPGCSPYIYGSC